MRVRVQVEVGALKLVNSELELCEVVSAIGEHAGCRVEFIRDSATDIALDTVLDRPLSVTLEDDAGSVVVFEGAIGEVHQEHLLNLGSRFTIIAQSPSAGWDLYRRTAVYPQATLSEVVRKLGGAVGGSLPPGEALTLIQNGESDFEFVRRLAFDVGCFVRPRARAFEVRRGFDGQAVELGWGNTLMRVRAVARPVNPGVKGAASQWSDQRDHRFHAVRKAPATLGGAPAIVQALNRSATKVGGGGDPHLELDQRRAPSLAAFRKTLERRSEVEAESGLLVEGSSTEIRLVAGGLCSLSGSEAFALPTEGRLGLVKVRHHFSGQQYHNDFVASPFANYVPRIASTRTADVTTAIVTENDDPQGRGWIRVRLPWMNADEATNWVPVVVPYAGNERGMQWLPEVEDHVVVMYEQGDPERPLVLGGIWNGKANARQVAGRKQLVSRAGHVLAFDDRDAEQSVELHTAKASCMLSMRNGDTPLITLHSEGDLSLEVKGQLRISAGSLVAVTEGETFHQAGAGLTMSAKGGLILSAAKDLLADAGLNARVAAGMAVETVAGAINQVIGKMVHLQPPGGPQTKKGKVKAPKVPSSDWKARPEPKQTAGATSADKPTPRGGG